MRVARVGTCPPATAGPRHAPQRPLAIGTSAAPPPPTTVRPRGRPPGHRPGRLPVVPAPPLSCSTAFLLGACAGVARRRLGRRAGAPAVNGRHAHRHPRAPAPAAPRRASCRDARAPHAHLAQVASPCAVASAARLGPPAEPPALRPAFHPALRPTRPAVPSRHRTRRGLTCGRWCPRSRRGKSSTR